MKKEINKLVISGILFGILFFGCPSRHLKINSGESGNPFCPSTTITYSLKDTQKVCLVVYDVTGKVVDTLVNQTQESGQHQVNPNFSSYASGVYFLKITTPDTSYTKKMLMVK